MCFFDKQDQAKIWSRIIIIVSTKMIETKNKNSKWKSCWVKGISDTKSLQLHKVWISFFAAFQH